MDVEALIGRWAGREGGAERANCQPFLSELCDVLGVPRPAPAAATSGLNDYVFERAVRPRASAPTVQPKRIDLYKRGAFILEAKQSRERERPADQAALDLGARDADRMSALRGRADLCRAGPGWDAMMQGARRQAEEYVFLLPSDHVAPPFLILCDVGRCLELYADFSGSGRAYEQFPDRQGFRIFLDDLRRPEIRDRLAKVWTDPVSLDPARESARVTRRIAERLAQVSKVLEREGAEPQDVAHFLMRCLFTMFAEDVELLPRDCFKALLERSTHDPAYFPQRLKALWTDMEAGSDFSAMIDAPVRHFNGGLFKETTVFDLGREEIGELLAAARTDWRQVDPAIFGTLLEQALDPVERKKLGAHYTPRAYVQRLVEATVMEPLRADWRAALTRAEAARDAGETDDAIAAVRDFHRQLCATRVLDPACGTGNFLYVALELMKKLEGEALQALADLGETQGKLAMAGETVDPHQFLGLELNPRAAAIAELVVWIGYLQWHYRNNEGHPNEPILRAFGNINFGRREGYDAVLTWNGYPLPAVTVKDGKRVESYPNPRRPEWPQAEFIVGNPPFIGSKHLRARMSSGYATALWQANSTVNESADLVMHWWDRAANLLSGPNTLLRRFGLVITNSITQTFQRRVVERHLNANTPISLVFAIPDQPWTKATKDSAAVRIAMSVAEAGAVAGTLMEIVSESAVDTDEPKLTFTSARGRINADLTVGTDVTKAVALKANEGLCSPGVKLHGAGFIVAPAQAEHLGLGRRQGLEKHIRPYRNGRDLTSRPRGVMVIDLFGLSSEDVKHRYLEVYQHILEHVKPKRDHNNRATYRHKWWLFGEPRSELRPTLTELSRYIATAQTAKYRLFQFVRAPILSDDMLIVAASSDALLIAVPSSLIHVSWAAAVGGTLENRQRYNKSTIYDTFPFPDPDETLRSKLRAAGEELDSTRKAVQAEHGDLTLTGLYNVLEKVRAGAALSPTEEDVKQRGRVLILKELHETIDALTAEAYGWPVDLSEAAILERLVALNAQRAAEEAAGHVRWLRPDYQIPRFAKGAAAKTAELALPASVVAIDAALPAFPRERYDQPLAVERLLAGAGRPMDAGAIARGFKGGGKRLEARVGQSLASLARWGRIVDLGDGRFAARRAA